MTRATSSRYSLKVLNGLYVSVLIALLAFFVKPERWTCDSERALARCSLRLPVSM